MRPAALSPGWYGKLPSLGDFASRRLGPDAVSFWDDWLCAAMLGLRESMPADWHSVYLKAPRWQFVLLPGALPASSDPGGAVGILMPSVDRVGRYFPLLVLQPLPGLTPVHVVSAALWRSLAELDGVAADALEQDWTVEQLDSALSDWPTPDFVELDAGAGAGPEFDLDTACWIRGGQRWTPQASGCTYWRSQSHSEYPDMWAFHGLPPVPADLLGLHGNG